MKLFALFRRVEVSPRVIVNPPQSPAPEIDWRQYDSPAWERLGYTNPFACLRSSPALPAFLRKQVQ